MKGALLNFIKGPLNVQAPKQQEDIKIVKNSVMSQYGQLLMAQRDADYARNMLKRSSNKDNSAQKAPQLDLSDRDRYYFKKTNIMSEQ